MNNMVELRFNYYKFIELIRKIQLNTLILILFAFCLNAQNRSFSFQHYGPEEGLSNANVFSVKQDKHHILYLATENGVYHFDGYNFSKIKPKTPLKSNFIRNISFDATDHLLIVNRREGIYRYDNLTNDVSLVKELKFTNSVDEILTDSLYEYSLTDQISVTIIEKRTGNIIEDEVRKQNNSNQAFAIYKTAQKEILIGRTDGLYKFVNGKQVRINIGRSYPVYSITQDSKGLIYLGSDNLIICLENNNIKKTIAVKTQKTSSFFIANNIASVSRLVVDKYERIWFTNTPDDNLYVIENNITYDAFDLLGIDKVLINCLYKDSDDHIWIGTFNDGVYLIQNPHLQNFSFSFNRKNSLVQCAAFLEKSIVVGTDNGLFIFDN